MDVKRSLCFGLLFLLKASLAQSAPHSSYPDEDEEALIDKLASFAAAVGPEAFLSKQQQQIPPQSPYLSPQNYDLASYLSAAGGASSPGAAGEWGNGPVDEPLITREALLKLPRQFGYKPTDIRFYLPADQFPPAAGDNTQFQQQQQQEQDFPQNNNKLLNNPINPAPQIFRNANPPPQEQQPMIGMGEIPPLPQHHRHEGQSEVVLGDDKSDFYFMKKKEQAGTSMDRNYVPGPSHIMASEHSVNGPGYSRQVVEKPFTYRDMYYIALIAGVSAAAVVGLIAAGLCWYRIHERIKATTDVDYPAYGVTGPSKDITPSGGGDRKLAQSAQMYHYQHQKQQMAALQKGAIQGDRQGSGGSDVESDDDNEDGDYTVYECPGLAPAGEMEVKNPLFNDDTATPATPNTIATSSSGKQDHPAASNSQDSCSSAPDESASSSASSTATITSSTPKITESPNTPPPTAPAPKETKEKAEEKPTTKQEKKGKQGKGEKK